MFRSQGRVASYGTSRFFMRERCMSNGSSFSEIDLDSLPDEDQPDSCLNCGKPFEEFGDLGCEKCDTRHPEFGL